MPLHPQIAAFLAALPHNESVALDPITMRAGEEALVPPLEDRHPVRSVEDRVLSTSIGEIPVRVYKHSDAASSGAIVYFHGGAFFLGSLDTHDHIARHLAAATGLRVVSVGYRLAPEHPFPAALEDAAAAVKWVIEHPADIGWDGSTLALIGDSSGATIATVVAAELHDRGTDRVTHQVLYYPSVDLDLGPDRYGSMEENAIGYGLETASISPFNAFYVESGATVLDWRVSPIKRADLSGLPPALVLTGEYDPMRDEGELYARRMQDAGIDVVQRRYLGAGHGFVQHFSWLPEYAEAFTETARFLGRRPQ